MTGISSIGVPRRRPGGGGYPRGQETRARIIAAALQVFGEEGYSRASTRQIADAAGVNPPALQYYFDSKEGLHRACAQFIIDEISKSLSPSLRAADEALASGDRDRILEAVCDILDVLADFSLAPRDGAEWSRFMGRGEVDDAGPAFAAIREGIGRPIHEAISRLVGPLIGRSPDADETRLRALAVLSPLVAFQAKRTNTLAQLRWPDFGAGRREQAKAVIRTHTRASLSGANDGLRPAPWRPAP